MEIWELDNYYSLISGKKDSKHTPIERLLSVLKSTSFKLQSLKYKLILNSERTGKDCQLQM